MDAKEKIKQILKQDNYKIQDGKVLRHNQIHDRFDTVFVSKGQIPLVKKGSVPEVFLWQDVEAVMNDLMDDTKQPSEPQKDAPTPKKKAAKKSNKHPKKQYPKGEARAKLTDDNLKFIAKNWQKISVNKMALKFGVSRFVVGHHVRKLKKAVKTI